MYEKMYRTPLIPPEGVMTIVKPGSKFEVVTRSDIGEDMRASPAISDGQMFLRGVENLYCIGK